MGLPGCCRRRATCRLFAAEDAPGAWFYLEVMISWLTLST